MDQNIACPTIFDEHLRRRGIAGKNYGAICGFEAEAERLQIITMMHSNAVT
jgi:hypothetical protein